MKNIKMLIFIVLLSVGFTFNGELYMLYLNNFQESYYQASFVLDRPAKEVSDDQIIRDFARAGERNHVDFFLVSREIRSAIATDITIYGTDDALQYLQSQGIREGESKSLFFGATSIHYEPFHKIKDIKKYDTCYFLGDDTKKKNLDSFKSGLIDQYGGGFPKLIGSDRETWLNLLAVWGIIFCLALMITLYEVTYQKKETMVRIILGENLSTLFAKSIMIDTGCFLFLFLLIPRLLYSYTNAYFKLPFITLLFTIFIFLNSLFNAAILRVHFKKDLAGGNSGQALLVSNYVIKAVTTILTILVLSGNLAVISDAYNLYQQRVFFESHKDYSYYQLNYKIDNHLGKSFEDDTFMNQKFYEGFQHHSLQYVDLTENFDSPYPVLLNNKTTIKEIKGMYPPIEAAIKKATEEKVYLLLPSNLSASSLEHDIGVEIGYAFFSEAKYGAIETIVYDAGLSLIGIHKFNNYRMKLYKNPILLYNNTFFQTDKSLRGYDSYYAYDTMYDIPPADFLAFVQEFQLSDQIVAKSNVLDIYENRWSEVSRNMKLTLIISAFLLILEMALIIFIIRLEYQFNAIELALKKVHGYSFYKRNRKIFTVTIFSSFLGILAAFILTQQLRAHSIYNPIIIGLLLLVAEFCYIFIRAKRTEKSTITSVLKGEII